MVFNEIRVLSDPRHPDINLVIDGTNEPRYARGMTTDERCEVCGSSPSAVTESATIGSRISESVDRIIDAVGSQRAPEQRPFDTRWSSWEYAIHVRDVLLLMRERLILGVVQERPTLGPGHFGERIASGMYRAEVEHADLGELRVASAMFARVLTNLSIDELARPVVVGRQGRASSVLGLAQHTLHEVEHHLADIRANGDGSARQS